MCLDGKKTALRFEVKVDTANGAKRRPQPENGFFNTHILFGLVNNADAKQSIQKKTEKHLKSMRMKSHELRLHAIASRKKIRTKHDIDHDLE